MERAREPIDKNRIGGAGEQGEQDIDCEVLEVKVQAA